MPNAFFAFLRHLCGEKGFPAALAHYCGTGVFLSRTFSPLPFPVEHLRVFGHQRKSAVKRKRAGFLQPALFIDQ
jgi:hypothetical protein